MKGFPEWVRWLLDARTPLDILGGRRAAPYQDPQGDPPTYYDTLVKHRDGDKP